MTKKRVIYPVSEKGYRIGEHHQRAKLTDAQVEEIRDLYDIVDAGGNHIYSYRQLAKRFKVHRATIYDIVKFRRRATTPAQYRTTLLDTASPDAIKK